MSGFLSGRTSLTSVATENLEDGAVTTAKIADVNVSTGKVADDAVTLAKMAPGTDGNLITYDASGNPAAVATGSATNILTSNGAGAAPTFQAAAAGGAWTLLEEQIVGGSVTSVDFESNIDSTYEHYVFVVTGYTHLGEGNQSWLRVGTGGTPTYQTSAYDYHSSKCLVTSTSYSASAATNAASIVYGENIAVASTDEGDAVIHMFNPANTAYFTKFVFQGTAGTDAAQQSNVGTGRWDTVTAVTAVRFLSESSNIDGGTFKLYGIAGA